MRRPGRVYLRHRTSKWYQMGLPSWQVNWGSSDTSNWNLKASIGSQTGRWTLSEGFWYGITRDLLNCMISYLTNRKQFVIVKGCTSQTRNVCCGMPQVSLLRWAKSIDSFQCNFSCNVKCFLLWNRSSYYKLSCSCTSTGSLPQPWEPKRIYSQGATETPISELKRIMSRYSQT